MPPKYLTISRVAKALLMGLLAISAAGIITSAVLFSQLGFPAACIGLIVAAVAFTILSSSFFYPLIERKLPHPLQMVGARIASLGKEFFALFLALGSLTKGLLKNKDPSSSGTHPLLLIHGFGMNRGNFAYIKYCLKKEGIGPIYTIDLSSFQSIEEYSNQVGAKVAQIQARHAEKITLIGHSMGGIVAARYLADCPNASHIQQVIALGSPLQGTYTAYIGIGKSAKQMRPHSHFLNKLEKDLKKNNIPFTTVGSQSDLIILPNKNASFKTVKADRHMFRSMGHNTYLFSDQTVQLILQLIAKHSSTKSL